MPNQLLKFDQPREIRTHLSDGTPNQKRIAIEPQPKRENTKTIEKEKKKKKYDKNRYRYRNKRDHAIGIPGTV